MPSDRGAAVPAGNSACKRRELIGVSVSLLAAFILFYMVFLLPFLGFWLQLASSTVLLAMWALAAGIRRGLPACRKMSFSASVAVGIVSALLLYLIFFAGNISVRMIHPDGGGYIDAVYVLGSLPPWFIGLLLLVVIGPCEEIFWRGYIQRRLAAAYGFKGAVLSVLAYAGVHIATGNPVLILAALVCGSFWTLLLYKYNNIFLNAVSHGVWAMTVFILLPLR